MAFVYNISPIIIFYYNFRFSSNISPVIFALIIIIFYFRPRRFLVIIRLWLSFCDVPPITVFFYNVRPVRHFLVAVLLLLPPPAFPGGNMFITFILRRFLGNSTCPCNIHPNNNTSFIFAPYGVSPVACAPVVIPLYNIRPLFLFIKIIDFI